MRAKFPAHLNLLVLTTAHTLASRYTRSSAKLNLLLEIPSFHTAAPNLVRGTLHSNEYKRSSSFLVGFIQCCCPDKCLFNCKSNLDGQYLGTQMTLKPVKVLVLRHDPLYFENFNFYNSLFCLIGRTSEYFGVCLLNVIKCHFRVQGYHRSL